MWDKYFMLIDLIISIINIMIALVLKTFSLFKKNKKIKVKKAKTIHIIANGLSLNSSVNKLIKMRDSKSLTCVVNYFANTDKYELIMPDYYFLVDKGLFDDRIANKKLYFNIEKKTKWKMKLFVPQNYLHSKNLIKIRNNNKIEVITFTNIPIIGGNKYINSWLYYFNIATPAYRNVLHCAIYNCLRFGFKKIYLWGADYSWLENITMKQDNNVYLNDKHFYEPNNNKEIPLFNTNYKFSKYLKRLSLNLQIYEELEILSNRLNSKILNMNPKSWIDAFEKKVKIND